VYRGAYIEIALATEDVADFLVDVEMFLVEILDHGGVLFSQLVW
jgi:hypothetical protein